MMTKDHTGLLPRQDDHDHRRRAARTRPARTRSPRPPQLQDGDGGAARRGDPRLPRRRAAARLLVAARVVRRHARRRSRRPPSSTPRRGRAGARRPRAPPSRPSDSWIDRYVDESLCRHHTYVQVSGLSRLPRSDGPVVAVARVHDVDDPAQVVQRGELDGDLALAPAEVDLDPGLEPVGEPVGEVGQARGDGPVAPGRGGWAGLPRPPTATISSRPRTLMPSATTRPASRSCWSGSSTPSSAPGVARAEHPGGDPALHGGGELEQPDGVADLRAGAADPLRPARRGCSRSPRAAAA